MKVSRCVQWGFSDQLLSVVSFGWRVCCSVHLSYGRTSLCKLWYVTQFTLLKCATSFLVYHKVLKQSAQSSSRMFHPPRRNPTSISSGSPFSPRPGPGKHYSALSMELPASDVPCKWNRTTYAAFCIWLFSLSIFSRIISVCVCIST